MRAALQDFSRNPDRGLTCVVAGVLASAGADFAECSGPFVHVVDAVAVRRKRGHRRGALIAAYKGNAETVTSTIPRLQSLLGELSAMSLTLQATEFWKRAIIEAVTANVVAGVPSERDGPLPSALKVVRRVEEYLDARPTEPVHISEICSHLHVPRRTLHRAFHEALGTGPIAFLRHRRLCATHTALRAPEDIRTISDIAMQFGFQNLGRFAGYYHQLFGEYPSETRQRHRPQLDLPQRQIS